MKSLYYGFGLSVVAVLSLQAGTQTTVYPPEGESPDFPGYTLQQILDSGVSIVKFAAGTYTIPVNYPPDFSPYGLRISQSVKLMALDKNEKPSLIVNNTDPAGADVNGFTVVAPGANVTIENLKFWISGSWQNNCVNCSKFELIGCEPADPPASVPGALPWFGLACGPWGPPGVPYDVAHIKVIGNSFMGVDSVFTFGPPAPWPGIGDLQIEGNKFQGSWCLDIASYRRMRVVENDIVVPFYWADVLAIGGTVCNVDANSEAMIVNNKIHMVAPDPVGVDLGFGLHPQIAMPLVLGGTFYDVPVYNVVVNNLTVDGATPLLCLVETWQAHDSVVENVKYSAANMVPAEPPFDHTNEALLRLFFSGKDDLFAISMRNAAEHVALNTDSLVVKDNNPSARLFEWPTPGFVRLLGRIAHAQP